MKPLTQEEKERVLDLCNEIQEIMPHLDSLIVTDGSLIMASYEMIKNITEEMGLDMGDLESDDDPIPLLEIDDDDDSGGLLQ